MEDFNNRKISSIRAAKSLPGIDDVGSHSGKNVSKVLFCSKIFESV